MVLIKSKPAAFLNDGFFPQSFNTLFNSILDENVQKQQTFNFMPAADILEHEDAFEIRMSLPGIKKEEVRISLDGDHLTIEGERKHTQKSENSKFFKKEISYGKFSRSFTIGKTNTSAIDAVFEEGVLTIHLPKQAESKATVIQVR